MLRKLRLALCLVLPIAASSCASKPTTTESASGGSGGEPSTPSAGKPSTSSTCPKGTHDPSSPKLTEVGLVSGQIVDQDDAPTSAGLVQVCGRDICKNARVGDDGKLSEDVQRTMDAPACKFGDGLTWGKLALPLAAGDSELGNLITVRLPDFSEGSPLSAGTTASSNGVRLTLAPGAHVKVDGLTYEDESQQGFRAARLPAAAINAVGQDFAVAYALSPVETRICPNPGLSLDNTTELSAGTALELYILGLDVLEPWASYAQWEKVSEGRVADDGSTLDFPDGLPLLTAIGIKEKP